MPAATQSLRVGQLQAVSGEMVEAARAGGLFAQAAAVDHAHNADLAYARVSATRDFDEAGMLVTRAGQRTGWITLPHDSMGSVLDPKQLQPRVTSVLRILALLRVPLAERYGFTARVEPLTFSQRRSSDWTRAMEDRWLDQGNAPAAWLDTVTGNAVLVETIGADDREGILQARLRVQAAGPLIDLVPGDVRRYADHSPFDDGTPSRTTAMHAVLHEVVAIEALGLPQLVPDLTTKQLVG